jgi:hypothetical protein
MPATQPFMPAAVGTVQIAATTTSARQALAVANGTQVRISNTGAVGVRVEFGGSSVAATTPSGGTAGSLLVPAGAIEVMSPPIDATNVAAKTDSGTATIEFSVGIGN